MLLPVYYFVLALPVLAFLLFLRLLAILPSRPSPPRPRPRGTPSRVLVVLGSGGHTAEMLSMLRALPTASYTHRSYLVSSGDMFSALKARAFEAGLEAAARASVARESAGGPEDALLRKAYGSFDIAIVPRARRIHQSLLTTPFSSLHCLLSCLVVLRSCPIGYVPHVSHPHPYPALIVTNGPATGLIVVLAAMILRFMGFNGTDRSGWSGMRCVFIESWARVRSLSLSGKILVGLGLCERFVVQWKGLEGVGGRGEYVGALVN